jgi:dTDP-4-amino-4,6-dideoxygalactose transaminase
VRVPAERRDAILGHLNAAGIGAGLHYPIPVHLTPAFSYLGYAEGSFPHAEQGAGEILSLPLYPQITAAQQERVVAELTTALG